MLRLSSPTLLAAAAALVSACYDHHVTSPVTVLAPPANLVYQLEPSGKPSAPGGILLRWDAVNDPELGVYRVFSRPSPSFARFSCDGSWSMSRVVL